MGIIDKCGERGDATLCVVIFDFSVETAERNSANLDRKQDLNALYQCLCFSGRSEKQDGRLQGRAKIGHGGPHLKKNCFLAQKVTATNRMHSNDLEACGMKLCCFLFYSDVKFLTRSLYSGERQWPAWASCCILSYHDLEAGDTHTVLSFAQAQNHVPFIQYFWENELRDNTFLIEWFAGINCIILRSQFSFTKKCTGTRQRSGKTGICDGKMIQFMPANHSNTNCVITILLHSDKTRFRNVLVMLLRRVALIFDVIANENASYKRN